VKSVTMCGPNHLAGDATAHEASRSAQLCAQQLPVMPISVDTTQPLGKLEPFWASQIIHPTESLVGESGQALLRLMAESGAARQFVRIYNQPEEAARVAADGTVTYDWSRFDTMADLILATGNKLKVAFFGMPVVLAKHPDSLLLRPTGAKVCISPPKDYGQWEALCADFTRHVIAKYGRAEVTQWTFRCWNEPDIGFWHKSDLPEYLKLYDYFAKGVKSICSDIMIGGPALASTATYNKPENFTFFLDHVVKGINHATGGVGTPIDFLSVHSYGGSSGGGGPGRKYPAVDYLIEQQFRYADMRDKYPALRNIPIHVEEWGETSGGGRGVENNPSTVIRNSEHGAAFLVSWVARYINMKQENDRNILSFTFCASGYEKPPETDFMGYRTLHTKNGFHKPVLNAYQLLSRMADDLVKVEGCTDGAPVAAFASCSADKITIMLVNYQYDQIENMGPSQPVRLTIKTAWAEGDALTLRHWRIDRTHSNAFTAFKEAGAPAKPTAVEVAKIKSRMGLELLEPEKKITSAELAGLLVELPCNGISLIEISKGEC